MDCILYYTHIVSVLLSLVTHQCTASDLNHNTILDIDDYQFHFSTYHYEFSTIQPLSATIKHPFEDHLNITLDIDLNCDKMHQTATQTAIKCIKTIGTETQTAIKCIKEDEIFCTDHIQWMAMFYVLFDTPLHNGQRSSSFIVLFVF
eukprot:509123_1